MDLMGIINLNEPEDQLHELTKTRPLAAVPFAGRYRLLDFVLSSMVNSGITNVGILLQHKYRALMDHLRSGKEWDLARKQDGLAFLPPAASPRNLLYGSDIENFRCNLDYISYSRQRYVVIAGSSFVTNIDFRPALAFHRKTGADITVVYTERPCAAFDKTGAVLLEVSDDGRVSDMEVGPGTIKHHKMSTGMFILERKLLLYLIDDAVAHGGYDFVKHCLICNLDKLKMFGYLHSGYAVRISSLQSYFQHNLDLLDPGIRDELFFGAGGLIYTKVKDEPPSKYTGEANVRNSLVAGGCLIEGKVENSILFRGVTVEKGASIKNCIVMQKSVIEKNSALEQVICDKNVRITAERQLKGDCNYPLVIKKGMVV